jgi:hypothetical protein
MKRLLIGVLVLALVGCQQKQPEFGPAAEPVPARYESAVVRMKGAGLADDGRYVWTVTDRETGESVRYLVWRGSQCVAITEWPER